MVTASTKNNLFKPDDNLSSWVIDQIEKWKSEGTPEAKKKLRKLFMAYIDGRGKGKDKDPKGALEIYKRIEKKRKIKSVAKAITHTNRMGGEIFQHTERDKYYEVKKIIEEKEITERNLRFEYYFPTKSIPIPDSYKKQFLKELKLYMKLSLLTKGKITFSCYRKEAQNVINLNLRFSERTISLEKAIKQIAKKEKIKPATLENIYILYKKYED